ncbi:MAG: response regulator transcription factor [Dehalococcoidales bacterium]|nr:response regulator transcription factor [Dehalococcoidales bacterium]
MEGQAKILVIEDDVNDADFIKRGLSQKKYDVRVSFTGLQGLEAAKSGKPDVVILEMKLPDTDGIDVCRELSSWGDIGIIFLSVRHTVGDRVLGLEAGADDYISKPFAFEELVARIRSVLRRKNAAVGEIIQVGDLKVDTKRRQVYRGSRPVELTTREFDILKLLSENSGRPIRREVILAKVWGDEYERETDPVKVYINFLRKKLNTQGEDNLIHALRGYGYVLKEKV